MSLRSRNRFVPFSARDAAHKQVFRQQPFDHYVFHAMPALRPWNIRVVRQTDSSDINHNQRG